MPRADCQRAPSYHHPAYSMSVMNLRGSTDDFDETTFRRYVPGVDLCCRPNGTDPPLIAGLPSVGVCLDQLLQPALQASQPGLQALKLGQQPHCLSTAENGRAGRKHGDAPSGRLPLVCPVHPSNIRSYTTLCNCPGGGPRPTATDTEAGGLLLSGAEDALGAGVDERFDENSTGRALTLPPSALHRNAEVTRGVAFTRAVYIFPHCP